MRKRRLILAAIAVISALAGYYLGMWLIFGYRTNLRRSQEAQGGEAVPGGSAGRVIMLDTSSGQLLGYVELSAYDQLYAAIGVDRDKFFAWVSIHGPSGVGEHGELLAPAYPVLSKVAWMFVDPVNLEPEEIAALVAECERASANTSDSNAIRQLEDIRRLAAEALARSATIRFGHA